MIPHRFAELFPIMAPDDLESLADDIKKYGQRAPITTLDGKILDGRNRWLACEKNGMTPKTREFTGSDPLEFVLSVNLQRRHLSESQRALVAAKIATLDKGGKVEMLQLKHLDSPSNTEKNGHSVATQAEAAAALSVSRSSVQRAKQVLADPVEKKAVEQGKKTVNAAVASIKAKKEAKEIHRDETGYEIPEPALVLWNRRQEVKDVLTAISKARASLKAIMDKRLAGEPEDMLFASANINGAHGRLSDAWTTVTMALPYAVCPTCQGRAPEKCLLCKGRAFISKHVFDHAISEELKAVRGKSCVKSN